MGEQLWWDAKAKQQFERRRKREETIWRMIPLLISVIALIVAATK